MNFTEQVPFESRQEVLENFPALLLDQATVPVGNNPLIVTVQVMDDPTTGEVFAQAMPTELTVSAKTLVLPLLLESPLYVALRTSGPTAVPTSST